LSIFKIKSQLNKKCLKRSKGESEGKSKRSKGESEGKSKKDRQWPSGKGQTIIYKTQPRKPNKLILENKRIIIT
jgi:hypothetical protein